MAYGDYGGRSYHHGTSRDDMVDVAPKGREDTGLTGKFHALLGEGVVVVGLYKQTSFTILRDGVEIDYPACLIDPWNAPDGYESGGYDADLRYFDLDIWEREGRVASFAVDGHRIDVMLSRRNGTFIHARLTEPDGTTWTGWSGYGIGAGHPEEYSPREDARIEAMHKAFDPIDVELPTPSP